MASLLSTEPDGFKPITFLMSNFLASVDIKALVTHTATHLLLLLIVFLSHLSIRVARHTHIRTHHCIVNASMSETCM